MTRLKSRLTFANVCSFLALLIALGTGSAYAANTVFSADIVDGEVKTADLANNSVRTTKIVNGQVANADLNADAVDGSKVLDSSLGAADLGFDSVGSGEIQTDAVNASEIADGSIDAGEIVDDSLGQSDLATSSVGNAELATNAATSDELASSSVGTSEVASNSLTAFDLAGGESNGSISLPAGYVANGACRDGSIAVGGANPGDAVLFSLNGSVPQGIVISGVRVSSADTVTVKTCNLTGAAMAAITNLQVAVVTITI
jgi:hypothetical protein